MFFKLIYLLLPAVLGASKICGNENCVKGRSSRVINGQITERNSRPFQVALYSRVGQDGELGFCGASLLSPQWVITAAHCCFHDGQLVDHVQAIFGAHSLYDRYENGRRIVVVDSIEVHPAWDPDTFTNDLALMRLANTLQITDVIQTVRLPSRSMVNSNFAGALASASGWGIATAGVPFVSPTLREYPMTVMTDTQCNGFYVNQLPPNTVCGFSATSGTCKGDNGGPMTIINNEEIILIGVTSFIDNSGCNVEIPSVFTRVQNQLDWISEVTGMEIN